MLWKHDPEKERKKQKPPAKDYPIKSADQIVRYFEEHSENDFLELLPSKNTGLDNENNYDKRNAFFSRTGCLDEDLYREL